MDKTSNKAVEIIPSRLYWISDQSPPRSQHAAFFFCIDKDLVYEPFCADFGPLNLGQTHQFCVELDKLLQDKEYSTNKIYHYCSTDPAKKANAAYLMGAFQIIVLKKSAEEAWAPFEPYHSTFTPFRDASMGVCTYKCTIIQCLKGLEYGISLKWYNYKTFNLREYQHYERVDNGDMNWILPGKFMAFSGPSSTSMHPDGWRTFTPEDYCPIFKQFGITSVVRLNHKQYERERFTKNGLKHVDLYFLDGSTPSDEIVNKFLEFSENEPGAIAVHCKAGLGRTGSLIACYAMKHYKFPAAAFIGWIRICRPGSILGPQQHWLNEVQDKMFAFGDLERKTKGDKVLKGLSGLALDEGKSLMSKEDKLKSKEGDYGQAERLINAKRGYKTGSTGMNS